jgi:protein-disulfide isomerase
MSIPASVPGHVLQLGVEVEPVEVELFNDFSCPFSAKMWKTVATGEAASVMARFPEVKFVLRQVPQPWHMQSMLVHEAVLAARRNVRDARDPRFKAFIDAVFERQSELTDVVVWDWSRAQIQAHLVAMATAAGIDGVAPLLQINADDVAKGMKNPGSYVTPEFKACVRYHRVRSVHVTPTVFVNGIEAGAVSSGWTVEQWVEFLTPIVAANAKTKQKQHD